VDIIGDMGRNSAYSGTGRDGKIAGNNNMEYLSLQELLTLT
jgi:hypothetical protein